MLEQLTKKVAYTNPYYTVYSEDYRLPTGQIATYYGIRGLRTALVIPFLDTTTVVLTKQLRYLFQEDIWEFPCGRVEPNEDIKLAAQRELEEETGYRANTVEYIGWFAPCNGLTDERCHTFVATNLTTTQQQLDATEVLTVHSLTIQQLTDLIQTNKMTDGMSLAAWSLFKANPKYKL